MDTGQILLLIVALLCILPLISFIILGAVLFIFGKRFLANVDPNVDCLYEQYTQLYNENPQVPLEEHVRKILHQESLKCGVIGAITGLGGFFTLPIALPIDMVLSMRLQVTMVQFVARAYGFDESDRTGQWATYMIMSRSGDVSRMSINVLLRYAVRIVGKSFSKLIPFIGAAISFVINYLIARSSGHVAQTWYRQRASQSTSAQTT